MVDKNFLEAVNRLNRLDNVIVPREARQSAVAVHDRLTWVTFNDVRPVDGDGKAAQEPAQPVSVIQLDGDVSRDQAPSYAPTEFAEASDRLMSGGHIVLPREARQSAVVVHDRQTWATINDVRPVGGEGNATQEPAQPISMTQRGADASRDKAPSYALAEAPNQPVNRGLRLALAAFEAQITNDGFQTAQERDGPNASFIVNGPSLLTSQDYVRHLEEVIEKLSNDVAAVRKLVPPWRNLNHETLLSYPSSNRLELRALELELEALQLQQEMDRAQQAHLRPPGRLPASWPSVIEAQQRFSGDRAFTAENLVEFAEVDPAWAARPPAWLRDRALSDRLPAWLDHHVRLALQTRDYASIYRSQQRSGLGFFFRLQFVIVPVLAVAFYVSNSQWIHFGQQPAFSTPASASRPPIVPTAPTAQPLAESVASAQVVAAVPRASAPQPITLTRDEIELIRSYIKMAPAPPEALPTISVGAVLPTAKLLPIPKPISDKVPALLDAKFTTDKNNAIIIVRADNNQVDLVIPPR